MKAVVALAGIALAGSPTTVLAGDFNSATDLLVFGHVKTMKYEPVGDDIVTDGQFIARLTITRVVRGRPPSPVLTIRYIAHVDRPAGYSARYHLRRSRDGIWLACREGEGLGFIC